MSELAKSDFTTAVARQAGELEGALNERLLSSVPEVANPEGGVDWKEVGKLELVREAGAVVLAHSLPDLMFDYARVISELEGEGKTDQALSVYELSLSIKEAAQNVLGRVSAELYAGETTQPGAIVRRRNGEITTQGETLLELGEALTLRMQEDRITTDKQDEFYENLVSPAVELVQVGIAPTVALPIVDMSRRFGFASDELIIAAREYGVNLEDENSRGVFATALGRVHSLDDLGRFSDGLGGLDNEMLEIFTGELTATEAGEQVVVVNEDDQKDNEEDSEPMDVSLLEDDEEVEISLEEQANRAASLEDEMDEDERIREVISSLDKPTSSSNDYPL